ncbi:MAG TPA: GDP-mannose 4,6-dehydratase [Caulobacteraceae bacterium]
MIARRAIITGVTGQDGAYLAELLLSKGYRVIGTTRRLEDAAQSVPAGVEMAEWDLTDDGGIADLVQSFEPSELYNFAAYSTGAGMFEAPVDIGDINGLAVTRILEAIRRSHPATRFFQASSSEMFGAPTSSPQTELTPLTPISPYGAAKLYGHAMVDIYRRRHGLFACSAILFNHESPRRGHAFVSRKVSDGVARIKLGLAQELVLGDLHARRDWGFSGDYVRGAWNMLQADRPDDYVLASGETHTVGELCALAFGFVGLDYREFVREDPALFRDEERMTLAGDSSKAAKELDWRPRVTFPELVEMMVAHDLDALSPERAGPSRP